MGSIFACTPPLAIVRRVETHVVNFARLALLCLAVLGIFGCSEIQAMGKVVLFSPVSGIVLSNGKPVSGAVLKRHVFWRWGNKAYDDETTTDAAGRFAFPERSATMLLGSVLPHEPYIDQRITIEHGGTTYVAWQSAKRGYALNDELIYMDMTDLDNPSGGGSMKTVGDPTKPITVTCSLESPRKRIGNISGVCSFVTAP